VGFGIEISRDNNGLFSGVGPPKYSINVSERKGKVTAKLFAICGFFLGGT